MLRVIQRAHNNIFTVWILNWTILNAAIDRMQSHIKFEFYLSFSFF